MKIWRTSKNNYQKCFYLYKITDSRQFDLKHMTTHDNQLFSGYEFSLGDFDSYIESGVEMNLLCGNILPPEKSIG